MTYFYIFIILLIFSIVEYYKKKEQSKNMLFCLSSTVVLLFCSLRYGVGFDYFAYEYIYNSLPHSFAENYNLKDLHGEYLFLRFFIFLKSLGIEYIYTNLITVVLINILMFRFIFKFSSHKCFSILILFSWYFVYIFSTLRQGLALGVLLGIGIPFLDKKKYLKYYLTILIATLLHTSAIVCLLFPLGLKFFPKIQKKYPLILFFCLFLAFIPNPILITLAEKAEKEVFLENSLSINALANRLLAFAIIYFLCKPKDSFLVMMKRIYLMGFLTYLVFAQSDLIASRLVAYFKAFEIILIPTILCGLPRKYYLVFIIVISIYLGYMYMNTISSIATLSGFKDAWSYPYETIF